MNKNFLRNNDFGLLLLRLTIGGLMLFHGVSKLINGVGPISGMLEALGLPGFIAYFSLAAELLGSVMIVAGLWTRAAAVVLPATWLWLCSWLMLGRSSRRPRNWRLGH